MKTIIFYVYMLGLLDELFLCPHLLTIYVSEENRKK